MKMISNFTDTTIQSNEQLWSYLESQPNESLIYTDSQESDDKIDGFKLLQHINYQFDLLYKENKKRKYLIKEVSSYIIRK
ncbi:MAG: hypothetical protein H7235_08405 [Bdellovibrionaceae bacterium]|nr:hypothetical protein [Pseudobdellovibrionaceae bacterium]